MPLEILLILVIGGIATIAGALHWLGLSRTAPLSEPAARKAWLRHFPGDPATAVRLSEDGRAALIVSTKGRGVLWQFGADTVARPLPPLALQDHEEGLRLRFADFTAPVVLLRLTTQERKVWKQEIEAA